MIKLTFALLFMISLTHPVEALVRGVNRPEKVIKINRPDMQSSRAQESAFQRCLVFTDFIVVEVDSHKKGAERIAIRELTKNVSPKKACSSRTLPGEIVLDINSEYVYGVAGDFIFTEGSDGLGRTNWMNIYSRKSPKALQRLNYHSEKDFVVTKTKNSLSVEFFTHLKLSCTLASKDNSCWERIKNENKIPGNLVEKPACDEVFAGNAFKTSPELKNNPGAIQVFARARIDDVYKKEITFLKGEATCDATP